MRREWTTIRRDLAGLRGRFMRKIIMGLIAGSLFFNLPDEQKGMFDCMIHYDEYSHLSIGLRTRLAVLFFANLFLAFGNLGIITPFYRDRAVFYIQREQKYYSPISYFISKTLLEFPFIILECIIFGTIIYWMVGLNSEANRFIFFLLILMAYVLSFASILLYEI
jgi:ABC-type multidrug transport system permease subunit